MTEARRPAARRRRGLGLAGAVAERAIGAFFTDGCPKLAAAISYYALFALFPVAILAVAVFGLVVNDDSARARVIDAILEAVPLRPGEGRADLRSLLSSVTAGATISSVLGAVGLLLAASGVMGAVRFALNKVWRVPDDLPPLRAKALDVMLVVFAGAVIAASLGLTVLVRSLSAYGSTAAMLAGEAGPALLAFGVYVLMLRALPAVRPRWRDVWPGALVGALGYTALKFVFGIYLESLTGLGAVYASLATVVAFLVFVWLSACLFLLGAEVSAALPELRSERVTPGEGDSLPRRARGLVRGLVLRSPRDRAEGVPRP